MLDGCGLRSANRSLVAHRLSASPIVRPLDPPFGGSFEERACTTSMQTELVRLPCRQKGRRRAVIELKEYRHGSDTSAESGRSSTGKESSKTAARAEQRLLPARGRPDRRRESDGHEGTHLRGEQGPADHQQVLVGGCVSVRAAAVVQGVEARWPGL